MEIHPGVEMRENLKSISHRYHLFEVTIVQELTKQTINLPRGCLQGGLRSTSTLNPTPQALGPLPRTALRGIVCMAIVCMAQRPRSGFMGVWLMDQVLYLGGPVGHGTKPWAHCLEQLQGTIDSGR